MRSSKTVIVIICIVGALLLVKFLFLNKNNASPVANNPAVSVVPVTAVIVKPQKLNQVIYATGSITANEEVEMHPEVAGKLVKILFKEGSHVSKGELLIKINDADLQAQLEKTNLEIKLADDKVKRNKRLLEIKGISQEDYDVLLNQLQSFQTDRDVIIAQIEKTEIKAPFDGLIGLKSVSEGSYITPLTAIATLQQIDPVKINFSIPEKYSSSVKKDDEIIFTVGSSDKQFKGRIYAIEPKVDELTRTIQLRALCPNANAEVLPGAFARISLVQREESDALMVPTESIVPILKGKQVYVFHNGKADAVIVETDIRNDTTIQITKGVNANDTIITSGLMQLRPGMMVSLTIVK